MIIINRITNTHGIIIGRQPNNKSERYEMIFTNIFTRQCETSIAFPTFKAAFRILNYAKNTSDYGLNYYDRILKRGENSLRQKFIDKKLVLTCYSDASFAEQGDSKSTTGYLIYLNGNLIQWQSKKQTYVVTSTAAAEFIAMSTAVQDCIWISDVLTALGLKLELPVRIFNDNAAAIAIVSDYYNTNRLRGVRVAHHFIKDEEQRGFIKVEYVNTKENTADALTKRLPKDSFLYFQKQLIEKP